MELTLPDGTKRAGQVLEVQGKRAVVQVCLDVFLGAFFLSHDGPGGQANDHAFQNLSSQVASNDMRLLLY